jgi:hypothetical protein
MEKLIFEIKFAWNRIPNSVKFWNGLVLLGLIISGIISSDLFYIEWGIMSVFALALGLDVMSEDKNLDNHIWIYFTPLSWVILLVGLIIMGCISFYDRVIVKFNNWLNKKK